MTTRSAMMGATIVINGDPWVVVDVAPAAPLAEMVAALLEEEGFVTQTRGLEALADALTHLGSPSAGVTVVVVPEAQAEAALALIDQTVTDYEGEELEAVLAELAADPDALGGVDDEDHDDEERDDEEHDHEDERD